MFLRYQTGRGKEEVIMQQSQHNGEISKRSYSTEMHPRQLATSTTTTPQIEGTSLMFPGSVVRDSSTTYTNPGFIIVEQLTTVTQSGSVVVKSQITVANIPVQTIRPTFQDNDENFTALLTDSAPRPTTFPRSTMSSTTATKRTTASVASGPQTTSPTSQSGGSEQSTSPIFVFVVVPVIAIGAILSIVSIILYRRSKKRHQKILGEKRKQEKAAALRPFIIAPIGRRNESLPSLPPPSPLSPPSPPRNGQRDSEMIRKPSTLLPSPLQEFPNADFPLPPTIPRKSPLRSRFPITPIMPLNIKHYLRTPPISSNTEGPPVQIDPLTKIPRLSIETSRSRLPSSSSLSIPSPTSRNKSLVSMESAIDPDLSFTVNGTSRLSTQAADGGGIRESRYNSFTYWGDYDFSRRPYSKRKSTQNSPTVTSPRLSPLGEDSIWEDVLVDADFDSRTDTDGSLRT